MNVTAGILLSQDVLAATWFQVLAAAVAFNSLVFLGLTVAKLIPWPQHLILWLTWRPASAVMHCG